MIKRLPVFVLPVLGVWLGDIDEAFRLIAVQELGGLSNT